MQESFPQGYFGTRGDGVADLTHLAPYKRHLVRFTRSLPKGARVLDVGCGAGKSIRLMLALRPDLKISAMDISDVAGHLPEGVDFMRGSVEDLQTLYAGRQFDAVICQHVIEHLLYPMGLMEGIRAVLRPGGLLFIETPNWTRLLAPWAHFYFYNDYTHVRPFSRFAMERLLREHALEPLMIKTLSSTTWFLRGKGGSDATKKYAASVAQTRQHPITRIFARIINPLMRDVLIAVAKRP